nr:hypothetical protein GCM10020093_057670 [Planobispora longispora]
MDFNLDETQEDLRKLAAELFEGEAPTSRIEAHEASGAPYDAGLWRSLAQAGLLGACLPEEAGGAGLGPVEMAVILRETGARVAPVPVLQSLVTAATIARYGSREQREALAPLAEGRSSWPRRRASPAAPWAPPRPSRPGGRAGAGSCAGARARCPTEPRRRRSWCPPRPAPTTGSGCS